MNTRFLVLLGLFVSLTLTGFTCDKKGLGLDDSDSDMSDSDESSAAGTTSSMIPSDFDEQGDPEDPDGTSSSLVLPRPNQ